MSIFLRLWDVWWRLLVMLVVAFLVLAPGLGVGVALRSYPVAMSVFLVAYITLVVAVVVVGDEYVQSQPLTKRWKWWPR